MAEKYLLFDLSDEKSTKLGEVISNPTCKKIINLLADKEMGVSEIAKELGMPLNSVLYNINKLKGAGLIEESRSFWSVKGKKMPSYKIVNKAIVISPTKGNIYNKIKGILPVLITGILFSGFILWEKTRSVISSQSLYVEAPTFIKAADSAAGNAAVSVAERAVENVSVVSDVAQGSGLSITSWFLLGIWVILLGFVIWSIRKKD